MITLAIEASNKTLSIALQKDKEIVAFEHIHPTLQHSIVLASTVDTLCKQAQLIPQQISKIIVSNGPGSYTGLRIGVTYAKTLAYTLKIPLIALPSLDLLANMYVAQEDEWIVPFFDARRHHVYAGIYDKNGQVILENCHISFDSLLEFLKQCSKQIVFISPDIESYQEDIITLENARSVIAYPDARVLARIADNADTVDPHLLTPLYLKKAEAEEKWLVEHQEVHHLVERVKY
ncbi:tRNA (adenosine(37)-N6)-threonylcarbamoyltransferase complex dimerization subunit type 1 TsaB [Granulicatella sp. zg-ZJ]|uniref:tRNA (adenosine(37)-N6)-threonylcarbamoyltransferase complex dimerization subunit type 1 TsaB n=1 Tax=Granulicatella sp. zg-ZJ TaxID=2678504 RepID=UPI0013D5B958|nr:tRNA (adenosine(37)-N6)-threonylcarbamoyltransferase complex dimerization subunit type 1 TsaB [Granulicatella sp. zg-ZJ]NEW63075.1 tRNA (adenosine(37)-N6)-threonylcarbamoyltransferase complex dimerization subunit type 1 TsaB [Granulicatella sp. zg-ZJ]